MNKVLYNEFKFLERLYFNFNTVSGLVGELLEHTADCIVNIKDFGLFLLVFYIVTQKDIVLVKVDNASLINLFSVC